MQKFREDVEKESLVKKEKSRKRKKSDDDDDDDHEARDTVPHGTQTRKRSKKDHAALIAERPDSA
jgi:hypothetical protein